MSGPEIVRHGRRLNEKGVSNEIYQQIICYGDGRFDGGKRWLKHRI